MAIQKQVIYGELTLSLVIPELEWVHDCCFGKYTEETLQKVREMFPEIENRFIPLFTIFPEISENPFSRKQIVLPRKSKIQEKKKRYGPLSVLLCRDPVFEAVYDFGSTDKFYNHLEKIIDKHQLELSEFHACGDIDGVIRVFFPKKYNSGEELSYLIDILKGEDLAPSRILSKIYSQDAV